MIRNIAIVSWLSTCALAATATPRNLLAGESQVEFTVKEMGVPVAGRFTKFDAAVDIDAARPERSSASIRIDVGSLTTGNDEADAIATSVDWLDKDHSQYATFRSATILPLGNQTYEARGTLTMKGRSHDIVLRFKGADQPDGRTIITSRFDIQRSEFGIGAGVWNQGGVVAETIPVNVRLLVSPVQRTGS